MELTVQALEIKINDTVHSTLADLRDGHVVAGKTVPRIFDERIVIDNKEKITNFPVTVNITGHDYRKQPDKKDDIVIIAQIDEGMGTDNQYIYLEKLAKAAGLKEVEPKNTAGARVYTGIGVAEGGYYLETGNTEHTGVAEVPGRVKMQALFFNANDIKKLMDVSVVVKLGLLGIVQKRGRLGLGEGE